jgi:hypothetical protein
MNFEDFAADTVVLKASEPDLQGTIKFIISTQILADHLGLGIRFTLAIASRTARHSATRSSRPANRPPTSRIARQNPRRSHPDVEGS